VRVVDLRPADEFAAGHIPTAENRSLRELLAVPFGADETVVLVSAGGGHAAQGWVLLAARGAGAVYSLAGGYTAWQREVMAPELPRQADAEARAEFARISELSRYFGGRPRIVDAAEAPHDAEGEHAGAHLSAGELARQTARVRRGGC
jgi:rhodanese-related sulfurtransferase